MDILDEEILNFWKHMHEHNVRYIMVGGFATSLHGYERMTADMDIWIDDTRENKIKLGNVLKKLELGEYDNIGEMQFIPGWSTLYFQSGFELDLMSSIIGFEKPGAFDEAYKIAPTAVIKDIPVKFLHINQLIETKKKANRPKDQVDIVELEKIRNKEK